VKVVPRGLEKGGPLREKCLSCPLLHGGIGIVHQGLGREGWVQADKVEIDHGHPSQPVGEVYRSVSHRVHRQVVPYRGDSAGRFPV